MPPKYAIHPDFRKLPVLRFYFNRGFVGVANALMRRQRRPVEHAVPAELQEQAVSLNGSDGHRIPGLLMRPRTLASPAPTLIYYHGGGFALTYGGHHLQMCRRFALEAGCQVFFPSYRLLPKHPFPAGFDDCYDTLCWVLAHGDELGVDRERIILGGDSAGGALAAAVTQKALDNGIEVAAQLLIYPVTDSSGSTPSSREFVDTPVWNGRNTARMWRALLPGVDLNQPPPYAVPAKRAQLAGLPPAYVDTAEFDPLRDEGIAYARAMQAAGVAVELNATQGTVHGFELVAHSAVTRAVMARRIAFLRRVFTSTP